MKRATIEYAPSGVDGPGWYIVHLDPQPEEAPRCFRDRYFAERWAKERGYDLTEGSPPRPKLVIANRLRPEGPFPSRYRVRAFFAWLGYWALTALHAALGAVSSQVWQARWRLGVVMSDRPCPRCGESLWAGEAGCSCELTDPVMCSMIFEPEAVVRRTGPRGFEVRYPIHLRRDLFHWARGHEFFLNAAVENMVADDRRWSERKGDYP